MCELIGTHEMFDRSIGVFRTEEDDLEESDQGDGESVA